MARKEVKSMETEVSEEEETLTEPVVDECKVMRVSTDEKKLSLHVLRLKLAVALAVIRSTPPEMTPQVYASQLIQCFSEYQNNWKRKYEILERDLITLEQKMHTISFKEKFNIPEIGMRMLADNDPVPSIPEPNMLLPSTLKTQISDTIEFVRSFVLLCSVSHENLEQQNEEKNLRIRKTILRSISLLFEYLQSDQGLSMEFKIAKCAIREIHRLFDSKANLFENELVQISTTFVENLIQDIYKTLDMNMMVYQHRRSVFIQILAEHKKLTAHVLCRLLREITVYSDGLAAMFDCEVEDFIPLLRIENTYYILQATEGTLNIMREQKSKLNTFRIPKTLLEEWNKTSKKTLLEIGSRFPIYSIYVWHIKALLQSVTELNFDD